MQRLKVILMMVAAKFAAATLTISYKLAQDDGMQMKVLIAYRYLIASILIFPVALFLERNKRPKLTWRILFHAFLCAILGYALKLNRPDVANIYAQSITLTSTTFVAAFTNLIPPFTFIIAIMFRLEKVQISKITGKAKVVGTLVGVGGAMILTFYKGYQLKVKSTHFNIFHGDQHMDAHMTIGNKISAHVLGSILGVVYSLFIALSYILQGICSLLAVFLALAVVRLEGPLFVSVFNPLVLIFVAIAGVLALGENLYVGSLLGSVIIIAGLYLVLWGKSKETKRLSKLVSPSNGSKDLNVVSNISDTTITLEIVSMDPASFSVNVDEEDELPTISSTDKHEDQEIVEED